jgi:hypothetical protein
MPSVRHLLAEFDDPPPNYGIAESGHWLKVNADTYRRIIRIAGGDKSRAQYIARNLIKMGVNFFEERDNELPIELIETYRADARSVFEREWRRLGSPPKPRLIDCVVSARDLVAAE